MHVEGKSDNTALPKHQLKLSLHVHIHDILVVLDSKPIQKPQGSFS